MNIKSVTRTRVYGGQKKGDWYRVEYKSGVSRSFRVENSPNTVYEYINSANAETKDKFGHYIVYTAKDQKLVKRGTWINPGENAPKELYEVYDEVDPNHRLLIYSGTSKADAIAKAEEYAKAHDIPLRCMKAYKLTKK